jgi:tetratricopeptide (TPR) repeat protein
MATDWQQGDMIRHRWEVRHRPMLGGQGVVYVVYDRQDHTVFAAKTFRDEVLARNPAVAERFEEEARKWIGLDLHPNIACAFFVEKIEGKPFVFTQHFPLGDLSRFIPRLRGDLPCVLRFAIHFCDGMIHALSKGIDAHRDIKPGNCLIADYNTLLVSDFGLAKATASRERSGGAAGTPEYMPPEQWDNYAIADERSDIYSFGAMLYEMVAGCAPFGRRPQMDGRDLERRHKTATPPALNSQLPALDRFVTTCLIKDPARRWASFSEARAGLAELFQGLTGVAVRPPIGGLELDAAFLNNKGTSLNELGQPAEALVCFDRALALDSKHAGALSNKGSALRSLGRNAEAVECLDRAIASNPHSEQAWDNRGSALDDLGRPRRALRCFERSLRINPRYAFAWYNKALTLERLGRSAKALAAYRRAVELDPWNDQAWNNLGSLLKEEGEFDDAIECYKHAIQINPRLEQALYNLGVALDLQGRHASSLPFFDRAIAVSAEDHLNWYGKGVALTKLGHHDQAIECYDRVITIKPDFEKAWVNRGSALMRLQRYDEALVCLDHALALNPSNGGAAYNQGMAFFSSRRFSHALACFERAKRLGYARAAQMIGTCRMMLRQ